MLKIALAGVGGNKRRAYSGVGSYEGRGACRVCAISVRSRWKNIPISGIIPILTKC